MKTARLFVCAAIALLLSSCGVSESNKEQMQTSLYVAMGDALLAQDDFVAASPSVELLDVETGESSLSPADGYHGTFSCEFSDRGESVRMNGSVGFDRDGRVVRLPGGKLAIDVFLVMVGTERVDVSGCIYNVPSFVSHRD